MTNFSLQRVCDCNGGTFYYALLPTLLVVKPALVSWFLSSLRFRRVQRDREVSGERRIQLEITQDEEVGVYHRLGEEKEK